jgi:DNA polymerase (family 10)
MSQLETASKQLSAIGATQKGFKKTAYFRGVAALQSLTPKQFASRKDFSDLNGIGKSINKQLIELKTDGVMSMYKSLVDNPDNVKQRTNDTVLRIPIKQAQKIVEPVLNILRLKKEIIAMEVCGSYRRQKPTVADADILVCVNNEKDAEVVANRFIRLVDKVLMQGKKKVAGECDNFQIDLTFTTPEFYPFALLHFTGSKEHNVMLRHVAKNNGWKLSQNGLQLEDGSMFSAKTEKDIFKKLDVKFKHPKNR